VACSGLGVKSPFPVLLNGFLIRAGKITTCAAHVSVRMHVACGVAGGRGNTALCVRAAEVGPV
jgi:hypothetical protein